ncbi:transcriptional regulator [Streptomyces actinomycinicus]|uniref:Transcriptional regulator n=1 Tax=Streptomyces actinomycinicus TaxID=1695166 RepID=A0A937JU70_9ACTN|nr:helix-turn-helix transcriptional regulator [Streptomyces actinomycinicus]MBL1087553.1 transcriptional regulator [Streptomyces actinomycinicus]
MRIDPAPAVRRAQELFAEGMAPKDMARQAGVSVTTVRDLIRGCRSVGRNHAPLVAMNRSVVRAVAALEYRPPDFTSGFGPLSASTGTKRRLQGLWADGYPGPWLAASLGVAAPRVHEIMHRERLLSARTVDRVARLHEKYAGVPPENLGLNAQAVTAARRAAARKSYVPTRCWDDDTIDDPNAAPEWTGRCGTAEGYEIHEREAIPPCPACEEAVRMPVLNGARLRERRLATGMTVSALARGARMDPRTVQGYESGHRIPQPHRLRALATVLGVGPDDLCTVELVPPPRRASRARAVARVLDGRGTEPRRGERRVPAQNPR